MQMSEKRRWFERWALARAAIFVVGTAGLFLRACGSPATTQAQVAPPDEPYLHLLALAEAYNSDGRTLDCWQMTTEHCFAVPATPGDVFSAERPVPVLQDEVVHFVDRPGEPRFLFGRLLNPRADEKEVLALAEFLMFATYDGDDADFADCAGVAASVLAEAQKGRFSSAEKQYPNAPIRACIVAAARRAGTKGKADSPTSRAD